MPASMPQPSRMSSPSARRQVVHLRARGQAVADRPARPPSRCRKKSSYSRNRARLRPERRLVSLQPEQLGQRVDGVHGHAGALRRATRAPRCSASHAFSATVRVSMPRMNGAQRTDRRRRRAPPPRPARRAPAPAADRRAPARNGLAQALPGQRPDLLGILLGPAGLRASGWHTRARAAQDRAVGAEDDGLAAGCADVQADERHASPSADAADCRAHLRPDRSAGTSTVPAAPICVRSSAPITRALCW